MARRRCRHCFLDVHQGDLVFLARTDADGAAGRANCSLHPIGGKFDLCIDIARPERRFSSFLISKGALARTTGMASRPRLTSPKKFSKNAPKSDSISIAWEIGLFKIDS